MRPVTWVGRAIGRGGDVDHEVAASILEAHPDYRVLRALPPWDSFVGEAPQGPVRTAAVIDVETIGLDLDHPIIDLAVQRIAFDERGVIVRIGRPRQWFEDPGCPVPETITRLTGITDRDVAGSHIDEGEAVSMVRSTTFAIAHNCSFDAPRIERRLPDIAGHAWACSCNEVPWPELGFDGRKLGHLLMQRGLFHKGHRAAADVWATINLLGVPLADGETPLLKLVRQAEKPTVRVEATAAPFETKDVLKARGYRWHQAGRVWKNELPVEDEAAERQWLSERCGCHHPSVARLTWHSRHRT